MPIPDGDMLFTKKLSKKEARIMVNNVTDKEIKDAMFGIDDNGSPGPHGYSAKNFKKAWSVIGNEVCKAIKEFFSSGKILGEMNAIIISLVPKLPSSLKVSDLRPIACCNVMYKCISKILTRKIKSHGDPVFVKVIKDSLEEFGRCSGLLQNFSKSIIFFGGLNVEDQQNLLEILSFTKGSLRVKYLGVPLITKRLGVNDCRALIDKIKNRVGHWKNKFLSYAGPLINSINHRRLYDARIDKNGCVADMMENGRWNWHVEWYDTLPTVTSNATPIFSNKGDKVTWVGVNGATKNFSMKQVYGDLRDNTKKEVEWNIIVNTMACNPCSNSIGSILIRLCFGATIYSIWQERNYRNFKDQSRDWKTMFEAIYDNGSLRVKYLGVPLITKRLGVNDCRALIDKIKNRVGHWKNKFLSYAGPLINSINHRRLYDARIDKNGCVADMMENGRWNWHVEWYDTLPTVTSNATPIFSNKGDKVTWVGVNGATKNFSMKQVYGDLRDNTKKEVEWNIIVNTMACNPCSNSIGSILIRLCFGATIYSIWQERNYRNFKDQSRDWKTMFEAIYENGKCKLMGLKVKNSNAVMKVDDL
nr:RNA-directed DNA polymerase, eukaryota, reverse transcriptase zinc-binding domain protein [Tanacetum cinerariifolium]